MRALALVCILGASLQAEEASLLHDLRGSETEFTRRFNEGAGRVRFLAILSPG